MLLLFGASLVLFLWAGTFFLQGYIYTEATPGLYWQAPAAAAAVTAFVALWCIADATADKASTTDIPYDTLFRFSPKVTMFDEPAKQIWALKKDGTEVKVIEYERERLGQTKFRYRDKSFDRRPWSSTKVEAIELEDPKKEKVRFNVQPAQERGAYREFVSDDGWVIMDYDDTSQTSGPTGLPVQFRTGRLLINLALNFGLFIVLFVSLWILLRYSFGLAFGLALAIWVTVTLALLPMLLTFAASVAQQR
jgi:hypothetical protein